MGDVLSFEAGRVRPSAEPVDALKAWLVVTPGALGCLVKMVAIMAAGRNESAAPAQPPELLLALGAELIALAACETESPSRSVRAACELARLRVESGVLISQDFAGDDDVAP